MEDAKMKTIYVKLKWYYFWHIEFEGIRSLKSAKLGISKIDIF